MNMNWRHYVREHLPPLNVSAERETEIVDELAMQLESVYERERGRGSAHEEAMARAIERSAQLDGTGRQDRDRRTAAHSRTSSWNERVEAS